MQKKTPLGMLLPILCNGLVGILFWFLVSPPASAVDLVRVKWIDDGDTILLTDGRRVRYIGINAPEVAHAGKGQAAEPFAEAATELNRSLVYGQLVRLEFDREKKDHFGRDLAYVFLEDGTFVNRKIVASGYAYVLFLKPNTRFDRTLLKAQRQAMTAGLGMWENWKEEGEKEKGIIGNRRSRRFHRENCPNAGTIHPKNRIALQSRWEAFWLGYAPAKQCRP